MAVTQPDDLNWAQYCRQINCTGTNTHVNEKKKKKWKNQEWMNEATLHYSNNNSSNTTTAGANEILTENG